MTTMASLDKRIGKLESENEEEDKSIFIFEVDAQGGDAHELFEQCAKSYGKEIVYAAIEKVLSIDFQQPGINFYNVTDNAMQKAAQQLKEEYMDTTITALTGSA